MEMTGTEAQATPLACEVPILTPQEGGQGGRAVSTSDGQKEWHREDSE